MTIPFIKMHGTGNDFVVVDGRGLPEVNRTHLARQMCTRHVGIGSDGLVVVEASSIADFRMDFYNPDGSQSFCGNGSRCAYTAAHMWGFVGDGGSFEAIDGIHQGFRSSGGVRISMGATGLVNQTADHQFIHTGSPHAVVWVEHLEGLDLPKAAQPIRYAEAYAPAGTNVNFVLRTSEGITMRTFERGVEAETLSCGTGVTAAALAAHQQFQLASPVQVKTAGGNLKVDFEAHAKGFENIWLEGPTQEVYRGEWPAL